ncbi:MAG: ABC transporter ATP-binding protein [Patescibacteria group bacterium]
MPKTKSPKTNKPKDFIASFITAKKMILYVLNKVRWLFIADVLLSIIIAFIPFGVAYLFGKTLDELIKQVSQSAELSPEILYLIAIYIGLTIFDDIIRSIYGIIDIQLSWRLEQRLREDVIWKFSKLDLRYYEDPQTTSKFRKVDENYLSQSRRFIKGLTDTIDPLVAVIVGTVLLTVLAPITILITFAFALPAAINNTIFGKRLWKYWDTAAEVRKDFRFTERYLITNDKLMEVRTFNLTRYLYEYAKDRLAVWYEAQLNLVVKRKYWDAFWGALYVFGIGLIFYIITKETLAGTITIGEFSFYLATARRLGSGIQKSLTNFALFYEQLAYLGELFEFFETENTVINGNTVLEKTKQPPVIEFKNVYFSYPNTNILALNNLNLKINAGENIAIVGENGAGKTTLIKLLMRFYDVSKGEILINGKNIQELDIETWYQQLGTLFQDFNRYHFSVEKNITLGNIIEEPNNSKIKQAAKQAQALEFIEKFDEKFDQRLNKEFEGGTDLSTGQWQKIALARTFYRDSNVIVLDEPTSAIDPKSEADIFDELFEFASEKSVIIVSHRFSTVRNAQRIIVIKDGTIAEEGTHEQLLNMENGIYKHAFEVQKRGYE